jgi:glycosyltransferase involved in cell wall biosynthesis
MKLLLTTQAVDKDDLFMGFFHGWLVEMAKHFEHITVICLKEGRHELPGNVEVHSLGKERGTWRITRVWRFFRYAFRFKQSYDAVFVHQNEEYVILAGWLWQRWGKKVYLWRNHWAGSTRTDYAARFCDKIFCTSKFSYTMKYPKTVLMPVGVDTNMFRRMPEVLRDPRGVLFYARLAPSKRPDLLLEALRLLHKKGVSFSAHFYGTPLPKDEAYAHKLMDVAREWGLSDSVSFLPGTPHDEAPSIFNAHTIYADLSASGMYNKTLFEAAACESLVITASGDFAGLVDDKFIYHDGGAEELCEKIEKLITLPLIQQQGEGVKLRNIAKQHSIEALGMRLAAEVTA